MENKLILILTMFLLLLTGVNGIVLLYRMISSIIEDHKFNKRIKKDLNDLHNCTLKLIKNDK